MRLKDKVILVTGSTTGIGEGMARKFAQEGARVIIHGLEEAAGRQVAADIVRQGGQAIFIPGALTDPAVPAQIIQSVIDHFGRIDGLVNNAASTARGSLTTTDVKLFDYLMAVNLRAPFLLIQAALPHFQRQGGGRVLNIGSINSYCGFRTLLPYSISKAGLVTLTRNLADAHGAEGIRVNLLNVGWTLTPNEYELKKTEGLPENWPSQVPKSTAPAGRILSPEDIAWAAVYFLSDEAALINGATLDLEQYPLIGRLRDKD
jgi:NAD(P)-dependent dehydrogenase (short-subunit alcohol dehydrogenase family)